MYKRIIGEIVKQKEEERIQQANQKRMQNAKYNTSGLLIGYVSKIIDGNNCKPTRMMSDCPKMFIRIKEDVLQDIETGKNYPLVLIGHLPMKDVLCVLENDIEPFVSTCLEVFDKQGIESDSKLTQNQARDILNRQIRLNDLGF